MKQFLMSSIYNTQHAVRDNMQFETTVTSCCQLLAYQFTYNLVIKRKKAFVVN